GRGLPAVQANAGLERVLEQVTEASGEEPTAISVCGGDALLHRVADRLGKVAVGDGLVDRNIEGGLGRWQQRGLADAELLGELIEEGLAVLTCFRVDGEPTRVASRGTRCGAGIREGGADQRATDDRRRHEGAGEP